MPTSTARLVLVLAALLGSSVALAGERTFDKRLNAPPGGHLTVDTDDGSVEVVGKDTSEVVVHAEIEGSDSFVDRFQIGAEQTPDGVTISGHGDRDGLLGWFGWFNFGSSHVRFTVEVPRGYPVELRTAGGGLDIRDVNARVQAHTSGGSIEEERVNGPSQLSTSGGEIEVTDSTGDLDLRTAGGGIRIQNDDGKVFAHTSGGSIRARLRSNQGVDLSTSGGSITLLLPRDIHASIEAHTSGGSVSTEFPVTTTEFGRRNRLRGDIGGGGAQISLYTSGGSIHILPET